MHLVPVNNTLNFLSGMVHLVAYVHPISTKNSRKKEKERSAAPVMHAFVWCMGRTVEMFRPTRVCTLLVAACEFTTTLLTQKQMFRSNAATSYVLTHEPCCLAFTESGIKIKN